MVPAVNNARSLRPANFFIRDAVIEPWRCSRDFAGSRIPVAALTPDHVDVVVIKAFVVRDS